MKDEGKAVSYLWAHQPRERADEHELGRLRQQHLVTVTH